MQNSGGKRSGWGKAKEQSLKLTMTSSTSNAKKGVLLKAMLHENLIQNI
jgi:hypothetical protein